MPDRFHRLRRHRDNPAFSYIQDFLLDLVSTLEDQQNSIENVLEEQQYWRTQMSQLGDQLTAAVATLTASVATHDAAVAAEIKALQDAMANNDQAAMTAAINGIVAANSTLQTETVNLNSSLPAPVQQASAAATQSAAPDASTSNTVQTNAATAADAAQGTSTSTSSGAQPA